MARHTEALIGETRNIHVRANPSRAAHVADVDPMVGPIELSPWLCHVNEVAAGDSLPCEFGNSDYERLLSLSLDIIERVDQRTSPRFGEEITLQIHTLLPTEPDPYATMMEPWGHGAGGAEGFFYVGHDAKTKKFVYSHELGHTLYAHWGGSFDLVPGTMAPYGYSAQDLACDFKAINSNSYHGIRSAEHGRDAYVEGFAQFLSATAFDDPTQPDAIFQYYKEIDLNVVPPYQEFVDDGYLVSLAGTPGGQNPVTPLGGELAWVETMCPADWDYHEDNGGPPPTWPLVEISSEIDWMRFLWQFYSSDVEIGGMPTAKPDLWHMFRLNAYVSALELTPSWSAVHQVISDPANADVYPFLDRFEALAPTNGVDNGA